MYVSSSFQHKEILGFKFGYQPVSKPKMFSHVYFIDGLLIDTGQSRLRKQVIAAVKDLPVQQIFVTHHHEDHTGNIEALKNMYQCKVFATPLCCELMKNPPKLSLAQKMLWGNRGSQDDLIAVKNTLKTKNFNFQLIPIPGHASDMVALYEPDKKWLFSADLYINSYIGYMLDDESIAQQIESIKTILQLDFDVLLCSHKPKLTNGKEALKKKLNFLETFYADVLHLHNKGYGEQQIFNALQLQENRFVKILSAGKLSKMNMVRSVIKEVN